MKIRKNKKRYTPFDTRSKMIFGPNGVGKSALIACMGIQCMRDRRFWRMRMRQSYSRAEQWRTGGYEKLDLQNAKHLFYCSIEGGISDKKFISYDLDVSRLGLYHPTLNPDYFFFPYGAVVAVDESQRALNSRAGGVEDYKSLLSEIKRHQGITLIAGSQRVALNDKNFRDLFHVVYEVVKMIPSYNSFGKLIKTTWICNEFESSQMAEKYIDGGKDIHLGRAKKVEFVFHGNIFKCYDSEACEPAFYDGAQGRNYDLTPSKRVVERTLESAKGFNARRFDFKEKKDVKKNGKEKTS